jgi:hypothetical protein
MTLLKKYISEISLQVKYPFIQYQYNWFKYCHLQTDADYKKISYAHALDFKKHET